MNNQCLYSQLVSCEQPMHEEVHKAIAPAYLSDNQEQHHCSHTIGWAAGTLTLHSLHMQKACANTNIGLSAMWHQYFSRISPIRSPPCIASHRRTARNAVISGFPRPVVKAFCRGASARSFARASYKLCVGSRQAVDRVHMQLLG